MLRPFWNSGAHWHPTSFSEQEPMATSPKPYAPPSPDGSDVFERLAHSESLLTAVEVARLLTIKPKTVYAYAARNLIPHYKIEASVRFRARDIADWLRCHAVSHSASRGTRHA